MGGAKKLKIKFWLSVNSFSEPASSNILTIGFRSLVSSLPRLSASITCGGEQLQETILKSLGEADYQEALKAERDNKPSKAITSFQYASIKGHLLATLRLAQIFNQGELEVAIDREIAATYFRSAAQLCGAEDILCALCRKHPEDASALFSLPAVSNQTGGLSMITCSMSDLLTVK